MLKFTLPLPRFLGRWLFPGLLERASNYGSAKQSIRSKGGLIEAVATAEMVD